MFDLEIFRPKEYRDTIRNIDFDALKQKGIEGIILDLDDTLLPRRDYTLNPLIYNFIEGIKDRGFKLCILSNNFSPERVEKFARELNLPCVTLAFKPLSGGYNRAIRILGLPPRRIAAIGDQLFMDIWGGNRAGVYTILVKPIGCEIKWYRKLMRAAEQWVLARLEL